jgi:hypothetical protein
VKPLNTVGGPIGANPAPLPAPTNVFLSGDDEEAMGIVSGLLTDLGCDPEQQIDLGGIASARAAESYFLLFAALMGSLGTPSFNIAIVCHSSDQQPHHSRQESAHEQAAARRTRPDAPERTSRPRRRRRGTAPGIRRDDVGGPRSQ